MPRPKVIGFHGRARSGKDSAANFLLASAGGYIYSFADPIRDMLRAIGLDMRDPYWADRKEAIIPALGVSPRRMMQTLGTEWGREQIHPDFWLRLAQQRLLNDGPGMIIPDVRFENEAAWVRGIGGLIVHIHREGAPAVEGHQSEAGISVHLTDAHVSNNGTLQDLQQVVKELYSVYRQT